MRLLLAALVAALLVPAAAQGKGLGSLAVVAAAGALILLVLALRRASAREVAPVH